MPKIQDDHYQADEGYKPPRELEVRRFRSPLRVVGDGRAPARTRVPEGAGVEAEGEEEGTEAEKEEDAPDRFYGGEVNEEKLADDEKERRHAAPEERDAVQAEPGDEEGDGVDTPGDGDVGLPARGYRELSSEPSEKGDVGHEPVDPCDAAR